MLINTGNVWLFFAILIYVSDPIFIYGRIDRRSFDTAQAAYRPTATAPIMFALTPTVLSTRESRTRAPASKARPIQRRRRHLHSCPDTRCSAQVMRERFICINHKLMLFHPNFVSGRPPCRHHRQARLPPRPSPPNPSAPLPHFPPLHPTRRPRLPPPSHTAPKASVSPSPPPSCNPATASCWPAATRRASPPSPHR